MVEKITSTQKQIDILDIKEGLVLLKTGGAVMIIQTNAVNFDLLSEKEQDAMIAAYATLLNSLSFPIQITIRSRRLDISSYLSVVDQAAKNQPNPYLREKLASYREFVGGLVQQQEVLDKRFYLIVPYFEPVATTASPLNFLNRIMGKKPKKRSVDKAGLLQRAKTDLEPKGEHLIKQLSRLGVQARELTTQELITLFYEIYNPGQARSQHLERGVSPYTSPLVEPALHEGASPSASQDQPTNERRSPASGGQASEGAVAPSQAPSTNQEGTSYRPTEQK
jgi:hypothetical protein